MDLVMKTVVVLLLTNGLLGDDNLDCAKCPNFVNNVGYLSDPADCRRFFQCQRLGDGTFLKHCMSCDDLYWSQSSLSCVRTPEPGCTVVPDRTVDPCVKIETPSECDVEADPNDPTRFFQRVNGENIYQSCPQGLIFIQSKCHCDYPKDPIDNKPPCDSDPLLYYPFDSDLNDQSCTKAHSSVLGDVEIRNDADRGSVAYFPGTARLEVPFMINWFNGKEVQAFSLAVWVKSTVSSALRQGLVSNGDCSLSGSFDVYLNGNKPECTMRTSGGTRSNGRTKCSAIGVSAWHHIAFVYDGSSLKGYLDGTVSQSRPINGFIENRQCPMSIGHVGNDLTEGFFNGYMDELRVYQRALTEQEVQKLSQA